MLCREMINSYSIGGELTVQKFHARVLQGLCVNTSFFQSNHQIEAIAMNNPQHLIITIQLKFRAPESCYQLGGHLCMGVSKWPLDAIFLVRSQL